MAKEGLGLEITELRLGLPGDAERSTREVVKKRLFADIADQDGDQKSSCPATKGQLVGWPPVCSYRKKNAAAAKAYVKVSMDGVPFLRKMDLGVHKGYDDLAVALEKLFGCVGIGGASKDAENCDYVPIYEDKDGDWMLAGDVPWRMFVESCKRLRILKKSDVECYGRQSRGSSKEA